VAVCNQNRIETLQSEAQRLLAKIGGRIDEHGAPGVFDDDRNSQSFIARVG
jgi:hypothetical protein